MAKAMPMEGDETTYEYYRYRFIINPERMCMFDSALEDFEWGLELFNYWDSKGVVVPFHLVFEKLRGTLYVDWTSLDIFQKQEVLLRQSQFVPNVNSNQNIDGIDFFPDWIQMDRDYTLRPMREATDRLFFFRFFSFSIDRRTPLEVPHFLDVMLNEHFESKVADFKMFLSAAQMDSSLKISDDQRYLIKQWSSSKLANHHVSGRRRPDSMVEALYVYFCEKGGVLSFDRNRTKWIKEYACSKGIGENAFYKQCNKYHKSEHIRNRHLRQCYRELEARLQEHPKALKLLNDKKNALQLP